MRSPMILLVVLPAFVLAQDKQPVTTIDHKIAATRFVRSLQDEKVGGFTAGPKDQKVSLKATSAAVRTFKFLTGKKAVESVPNVKETVAFVKSCYDPNSGGFADTPGGKPDLYTTAVGIMAAAELDIPKDQYAKSMDYLKENAKSFEDVRIAGAAVEAWGVKDCPFDLKPWLDLAAKQLGPDGTAGEGDGISRETASIIALQLRLGVPERELKNADKLAEVLQAGQRKDGGYGRADAKSSDLESTYRVMRAFVLLKERPKNHLGVRAFLDKCRNADGGHGFVPGSPSTIAGAYYATSISKWLNDMQR
jgi:prenyltransferase beta subunit